MATRLTERSPLVPVPAPDDPPPAAYRPRLTTARLIALAATGALAACATIARAGHPVTSAPRGALASARRLPDAPATPTEETFRIFDDAPERRASVAVGADGHRLTLPWQPVSLGASDDDPSASPASPVVGAVVGHGLHCGLRAMPWLVADVHPSIPTAVFGARAGAESDTKFAAGADRWLAPAFEAARGMNDDGTALNPPPRPDRGRPRGDRRVQGAGRGLRRGRRSRGVRPVHRRRGESEHRRRAVGRRGVRGDDFAAGGEAGDDRSERRARDDDEHSDAGRKRIP